MNILLICNKSPYPPKEGGPIAMNAIIEGLLQTDCKLKVLAINTNKYYISFDQIPENYRKKTNIELEYIDLSIKPIDAFLNIFTGKSYHVQRFISKTLKKRIVKILRENQFDIIQFETLFITPYIDVIRKHSDAKIILRAHNIEHLIWQRITRITKNPLKKLYLNHLQKTLKKFEISSLERFDGIATITKRDGEILQKYTSTPIKDISFGIDTNKFPKPLKDYEFPSLFHIGAMNWIPNIEGIRWFLHNVWPEVHKKYPVLSFYLAGREMPDWLTNSKIPNLQVVGEVDDAYEFINSKAIMIVPLFSGSGIRIKIIEGMALGKAVISTSIGAEGINYTHNKNILIAETAEEYLQEISKCVESSDFVISVGNNAHDLIYEEHNNKKIIKRLIDFYQEIL